MRAVLLTTVAIIALPAAASAQVTPDSTTAAVKAPSSAGPSGEGPPSAGLSEIIVTAQHRSENLQRAAVAVDVVQGAALVKAGITQIDRLGQLSPALTVEPTSTGNLLFLRGVGNFTVTPNSDPAIAFNYDGIYIGRPTSTTGLFFDLDRIEVLKGPQGTLYGRNATGGAINLIPTQPKLGELSGYGTVSYGNYNAVTAEGAINVPMGDKGALRISGSVADHNGYLKDGTDDQKTSSLRTQMKVELTPELTVRVSGDYSHSGGTGSSVSYLGNYVYSPTAGHYNFVPSNVPVADGIFSPAGQAYRKTVTAGNAKRPLDPLSPYPFQNNNFYGADAQIDYRTGIGTLTVVPAWRSAKLNYLSDASGFDYRTQEQDNQYSVEARFAGNRIGIFNYTLGGYYYDERIDIQTALSLSSASTFLNEHFRTHSFAPFGRVTANLTEKLRLVGGLRYSKDRKSFIGSTTSGAIVCRAAACPNAPLLPLVASPADYPFPFPAQGGRPDVLGTSGAIAARTDESYNSRLTNSRVTYHAGIEYDVAPHSLAYATMETGYRSGGFNAAQGFTTFQPELITAYTIGLKNRFLDNRIQLNFEGFYWKYKDQQVSHTGIDAAGNSASITQNIGSSTIKGVEAEARILATPTTLLSGDVQYLDAKDTSYVYQIPYAATPPLTGCAVSTAAGNSAYVINCTGRTSYNSPKWTINLAGEQTIRLRGYKLVGSLDTQFKSKRDIGFQYLPQQTVNATWTTNAQLALQPDGERWSLAVFVRNIENDRIPVYSSIHPTANILAVGTTAPRTFGGRLSYKF